MFAETGQGQQGQQGQRREHTAVAAAEAGRLPQREVSALPRPNVGMFPEWLYFRIYTDEIDQDIYSFSLPILSVAYMYLESSPFQIQFNIGALVGGTSHEW